MIISSSLKSRFCTDCKIPIDLYHEPYFTERLKLYDKFYGTLEKYDLFVRELQNYNYEQVYFEDYNRVKDEAINSIKNSEAFQRFNEEDMNKYCFKNNGISSNNIFHPANSERLFLSIDMKKANFSALHHYDAGMFSGASTWEEFLRLFTNNKHIINSKYIRQAILGNCNPKKHITFEKCLMDGVLSVMNEIIPIGSVVSFTNDEIVYDLLKGGFDINDLYNTQEFLDKNINTVPLKAEVFALHKINGTEGYYKEIIDKDGKVDIEFKCLDSNMLPFVIRKFCEEEVTENDKVFYHKGLLAKYFETPEIEVNLNGNYNQDSFRSKYFDSYASGQWA